MPVIVDGLRTDGHPRALRLGWRLAATQDVRDIVQAWSHVEVRGGDGVMWDSGRVDGWRPWARLPRPLGSRARATWRVRAGLADGTTTAWSDDQAIEVGLLDPSDWVAEAISPATTNGCAPRFRRTFDAPVDLTSARLHITALGVYEIEVNGRRVGDDVLAPGWTAYRRRLAVRTHDVTSLLRPGATNEMCATVAPGWYAGRLGFRNERAVYGDRVALFAQLEIDAANGRTVIATDETWSASHGPVVAADLYDGEDYDARLVDRRDAAAVEVVPLDRSTLVPMLAPPVTRRITLTPTSVTRTGDRSWAIDVGQNVVGWLRLTLRGLRAGDEVVMRHAEVLDGDGKLFTAALRTAKATDRYVASGDGAVTWEPSFTFHGFRYATVDGIDELRADDVEAVAVHSALEDIGVFACSDASVQRLHENIRWGWRGNSLSLPTDCPQRDERLGWTGDAQVFAPTACFLTDAESFLDEWLADLAADQRDDGAVPHVVPDILDAFGAAGWGDAAITVPWSLYQAYGDDDVLRRAWPSIERWVDWVRSRLDDDLVWSRDFQFGDWLDPDAPADKPFKAKARFDVVATAHAAYVMRLAGRIAGILGDEVAAKRWRSLGNRVAASWWRAFAEAAARTQTGCAIALCFDLAPADERAGVARSLDELVATAGDHLATGFLGTPLLCPALSSTGFLDRAYAVLLQRTYPSWLYAVDAGATTIWERWDALRPDGTIAVEALAGGSGGSMVSFNHYAYGAIGEWLHATVAGLAIDPDDPAYHHVLVQPRPGGGLTSASASIESRFGHTSVSWRLLDGVLRVDVVVPPNASATIDVPGCEQAHVGSGAYRFEGSFL